MTFNPAKSFNALPYLPPKALDFNDPEILKASLEAAAQISALRAMMRQDQHNISHAINMMRPLFVPEAVASSNVENIATTNEQVYRALTDNEKNLSPQEKEVINYLGAVDAGYRAVKDRGALTMNDYIELQRILEPKKAGLRKIPGTTVSNAKTGEVYYTPPDGAVKIHTLLANYENYYNEKSPAHEVYARMAILHYQFEAIHPFYDGNGRTGRMLMPLYLVLQEQLDAPVLFISRYIFDHRDEYYRRLREVTRNHEWKEWILFITRATTEQAKYTTEILVDIQRTINIVREDLLKTSALAHRVNVIEFIFSQPFFGVAQFQKDLDISYATARKYLEILEKRGLLMKKKQKNRNRFLYANPHYIAILKRT